MIERNDDVILGNDDLELLYTFKDFPIFMGCTDEPNDMDHKMDMSWYISKKSGMIQLNPLAAREIVYSDKHGSGRYGKGWDEHHKSLAKFLTNFEFDTVLEIGGLHGKLLQNFSEHKQVDWTIIEPNPDVKHDIPCTIIKGFFDESFESDKQYDCIIHSHVIEHAYDIHSFISKQAELLEDGSHVIFSVPNMEVMMERKFTNTVNFEHTIFLTEPYINYIMSINGFELAEKELFKSDHSIFYSYRKNSNTEVVELPENIYEKNKGLYQDYLDHHEEIVKEINDYIEHKDSDVFLFGAHVFSQYLLSFGIKSNRIRYLIDNDKTKNGKRLSGTNLLCYLPQIIENYEEPIVILKAGTHNEEIKKQLLEINPSTTFI